MKSVRAEIPARLNASLRSRVGAGMNRSASGGGGAKCEAL